MAQTRSAPSEHTGEESVKPLLWVGTSPIAGRGLFTAQPIARGTRIIQYTGEKITKGESDKRLSQGNVYIFQLNDRYDIDGKVLRNKARYINHSCDPNCVVQLTSRTIWIVARRDITVGEELTYNYGYELDDTPVHPCTCGAETCCGAILAPQFQDVLKHRRASARGV
jgi:SET domain-containing protein